jgi:chromosome segregation ATPase
MDLQARFDRLNSQAANLADRRTELTAELERAKDHMAELIARGEPEVRSKEAQARALDLANELEAAQAALEAISSVALPKASAELADARQALLGAVSTQLDLHRVLMEDEAEKLFTELVDHLHAWDDAVSGLLDQMGIHDRSIGLSGGSERLYLRCTSRAFLQWSQRALLSQLPTEQHLMQLAENRRRFAVEPKPAEQEAA